MSRAGAASKDPSLRRIECGSRHGENRAGTLGDIERCEAAMQRTRDNAQPEGKAMKAIRVGTFGGPEVLQVVERPVPTPGEQDVVVQITAIGTNFDDVLDRSGETERDLPYTPGFEAVGTIVAVGDQVSSRH